jgi:hypothetical protein
LRDEVAGFGARRGTGGTPPAPTSVSVEKSLQPSLPSELQGDTGPEGEERSPRGSFTGKMKGNTAQEVSGKYVIIWEKTGADWMIATDIWNMNK